MVDLGNSSSEDSRETSGGTALTGSQIARATGLVMIGFLLSRLLGLAREMIVASIYGASSAYDAYVAALRPPDTIFFVIAGGALGSAFIPTFTAYLAQEKREEAWELSSTIFNLITVILMVFSGLAAIFALPLVKTILAPGFEPEVQVLTAQLMRIMLISPIIFGISGLQMGILNAHQRFLLPALAPALYNVGIIIGALFFEQSLGIYGLAWGVVLGAALHLFVQTPGMIRLRVPYKFIFNIKNPGVIEVLRLMGPRVIGLAIVQINFWVNTALGSGMVKGSVAALQRAWFILLLPQGLIAQSVATAVFPTFSAQVARGEQEELKRTLSQVLRAVLFLAIPAAIGLVMLRLPIVQILYERGEFTAQDSNATAWALMFFGFGLIAHALVEIITRAFYALHDTRTPVLIGGGAMLLNVVLSLTFIQWIGEPGMLINGPFGGLALANSIATTLEGIALLVFINPRVGGLEGKKLLVSLGRASVAGIAMGLFIWQLTPVANRLGLYTGTLGIILVAGMLFWGTSLLLNSAEARLFTDYALKRLRRGA